MCARTRRRIELRRAGIGRGRGDIEGGMDSMGIFMAAKGHTSNW